VSDNNLTRPHVIEEHLAFRRRLVQILHEADVAIRNDVGRIQWQHEMAERPAACTQCNAGHFDHVL
jgi:hypothetical protein